MSTTDIANPSREIRAAPSTTLRLFSWNLNGLRAVAHKHELQNFFAKFNPDIFCAQEIKMRENQFDDEFIRENHLENIARDYEIFWNSAAKSGYSGTAIFVRRDPTEKSSSQTPAPNQQTVIPGLSEEPSSRNPKISLAESSSRNLQVLNFAKNFPEDLAERFHLCEDAYGDPNREGRVLTLEFRDFFLVTVYTPNSKRDLSRLKLRASWDHAFLNYLQTLRENDAATPASRENLSRRPQKPRKPIVFCGDLNVAHEEIDLANPKENRGKHGFTDEERAGFANFLKSDFIDSFRELHPDERKYSWWTHWAHARERNVGWRIDYFLLSTDFREHLQKAEIFAEQRGSDHCPIGMGINL